MRREGFRVHEALGRAEFAAELSKVRIVNHGEASVLLYQADEDGGRTEKAEVVAFALCGAGMDEARFFTCVDPFAPEGRPLYAAGEIAFGSILPGTRRCEDREGAAMEAVKFALRIPEDERAAAWGRMKAFGAHWRSKAPSLERGK